MMSNDPRFERNLGWLSHAEQGRLEDSTVAIAGVGGDGGELAVQLARMGVGEIRLADPDPFEVENINRQAVSSSETVGVNKAVAVADYINRLNMPDTARPTRTVVFTDGITMENTAEFVEGADLVIDETEFTLHALGIMLAREARKRKIPDMTVLNVGFGMLGTTYAPDGPLLEHRLGFTENQAPEEIAAKHVKLDRWLPWLPPYADLDVFKQVAEGQKSAPSVGAGVALAAGIGAVEAFLNLTHDIDNHRRSPIYAPKAIMFDAMQIRAKKINYTRSSHYRSLAKLVAVNAVGRNPIAGYAEM